MSYMYADVTVHMTVRFDAGFLRLDHADVARGEVETILRDGGHVGVVHSVEVTDVTSDGTGTEPKERQARDDQTLTLRDLREANLLRFPLFKNALGEPAHAVPEVSDWTPNDWYTAVSGELGELGNKLKKVRRGDYSRHPEGEVSKFLSSEIGDVLIYLDFLAMRLGLRLDECVTDCFNDKSDALGLPVKLHMKRYTER